MKTHKGLPDLPIEPLAALIEKACEQYVDPSNNSLGRRELARRFADRFGCTPHRAEGAIRKILTRRFKTVRFTTADEWCIALGTHISLVYDPEDLDANELIEVGA